MFLYFTKLKDERNPLTKSFLRNESGEVVAQDGFRMANGWQELVKVSNLREFNSIRENLTAYDCFTYSLCDMSESCMVVVDGKLERERAKYPGEIIVSRTMKHFMLRELPGFMVIDYDYKKGQPLYSREELREILITVFPELKDAPMMICDSTRSFIWDSLKREYIKGEGGKKIYIPVLNAKDQLRIKDYMFYKLWLHGYGFCELQKRGDIKQYAPLDRAMFQNDRVDYVAGCFCGDNIEQHTRPPLFYNEDNSFFDTSLMDDKLSDEDMMKVHEMVRVASLPFIDQAVLAKSKYFHISKEQARIEIEQGKKTKILPLHITLYFKSLGEVTVEELLQKPEKYHNQSLGDPIDPEYTNSTFDKAKFYHKNNEGKIINLIVSWAHGEKEVYSFAQRNRFNKPQAKIDKGDEYLLSLAEGQQKVEWACLKYIKKKQTTAIFGTVGVGKSHVIQRLARQLPPTKYLDYAVPDHELAAECFSRLNKFSPSVKDYSNGEDIDIARDMRGTELNKVVHLFGKNKLCANKEAKEAFESANVSIPFFYCRNKCPFFGDCPARRQYEEWANIRVLTHSMIYCDDSVFDKDFDEWSDEVSFDSVANFKPHYLVIDESSMPIKTFEEHYENSEYQSIKNIIHEMSLGCKGTVAVMKHLNEIKAEHCLMNKRIEEHKQALKNMNDASEIALALKEAPERNVILECLYQFAKTLDKKHLTNIRYIEKSGSLRLCRLTPIHKKYDGVPLLLLDATGVSTIYERVYPGVEIHKIDVRKAKNVKVYQISDRSMSKSFLGRNTVLPEVMNKLKQLVKMYGVNNVVLITYMSIPTVEFKDNEWNKTGYIKNFDLWLGKELGLNENNIGHFGNVRGKDKWKDKHIIVLGRNLMPAETFDDYVCAIYGIDRLVNEIPSNMAVNSRMSDGSIVSLSNSTYLNTELRSIHEMTCVGDQKQNDGRIRPVHELDGGERHLWLLSNTSLGVHYEIDEFLTYDEFCGRKQDEITSLIRGGGIVLNKRSELLKWFSKESVDRACSELVERLSFNGFELKTIEVKNNKYRRSTVELWIYDDNGKMIDDYLLQHGLSRVRT